MTAAVALREMLKLLEEHELFHCKERITRAQHEARVIVREAHRSARSRMHRNIAELRRRTEREIALAEAELNTAVRRHRQRREQALIAAGWEPLTAALARRWRNPAARSRWTASLVERALATLPRGPWRVAHPPGWPEAERKGLIAALQEKLGDAPALVGDETVTAGLRLCAQGTCLDGTLEGMLADRTAIEAMLLAALQVSGC